MIDREHRTAILGALTAALRTAKADIASADATASLSLGGSRSQARQRATVARNRLAKLRAAYAAVSDEQVHENTARIHLAEVTRWHGESGYQAAGEYAIAPHSGHARYDWAARQLTAAVEAAREYLEGR